MAQTAFNQANEAYNKSLRLLSEAESLVVHTVDTDSLMAKAQDIKAEVGCAFLVLAFIF